MGFVVSTEKKRVLRTGIFLFGWMREKKSRVKNEPADGDNLFSVGDEVRHRDDG